MVALEWTAVKQGICTGSKRQVVVTIFIDYTDILYTSCSKFLEGIGCPICIFLFRSNGEF